MFVSTRIVVFDVETTGITPWAGHRIIEIGAVCLENGLETCAFHSLVNPGRKVPAAVQRIHGICDDMLCGQPPPSAVYPGFLQFIKGAVLVAHNAKFDIAFLRNEFARMRIQLINPACCTLALSRRCLPDLPNHRLHTVARHLLGDLAVQGRRHRALEDARLTARVWLAMDHAMHTR